MPSPLDDELDRVDKPPSMIKELKSKQKMDKYAEMDEVTSNAEEVSAGCWSCCASSNTSIPKDNSETTMKNQTRISEDGHHKNVDRSDGNSSDDRKNEELSSKKKSENKVDSSIKQRNGIQTNQIMNDENGNKESSKNKKKNKKTRKKKSKRKKQENKEERENDEQKDRVKKMDDQQRWQKKMQSHQKKNKISVLSDGDTIKIEMNKENMHKLKKQQQNSEDNNNNKINKRQRMMAGNSQMNEDDTHSSSFMNDDLMMMDSDEKAEKDSNDQNNGADHHYQQPFTQQGFAKKVGNDNNEHNRMLSNVANPRTWSSLDETPIMFRPLSSGAAYHCFLVQL